VGSAPPRPDEAPAQRRAERRWLPAVGVVAVILVVTGGARVVEGAISGSSEPVVVGETVTVVPEPGWTVISTSGDAGAGQALLARGSASLLVFEVPPGSGPAEELARGYAQALDERFAQLTIGEAAADGAEAVRFGYVGITADGVAVEGVVAAFADPVTGAGAIFDGFAPKGSLGAAIGDLRTMVETAEVG
jgi:hypothetical protein